MFAAGLFSWGLASGLSEQWNQFLRRLGPGFVRVEAFHPLLWQPDDESLDPLLPVVDASSGDDLAIRAHGVGVDESPRFIAGHTFYRSGNRAA